jgi:hypothetical protein
MEEAMKHTCALGILFTALTVAGPVQAAAQDGVPFGWQFHLIPEGDTVYDTVNNITWLADGNLAAQTLPGKIDFRFGLPLCPDLTIEPTVSCVNASGSFGGRSL